MTHTRSPRSSHRGAVLLGLAGGLVVASAGLLGAYAFTGGGSADAAAATGAKPRAGETPAVVDLEQRLGATVEVVVGGERTPMRWADLGATVEGGGLVLDRGKALAALADVKSHQDRAPIDAYLDLEARTIHAERPGLGVDLLGSLPSLMVALRSGATRVELATVALPAKVTREGLGIDDISTVLGHYTTKFSVSDKERNFNLKLAASKFNGHVMQPGVEFSFNDITGERTEKQGYKVAHVISAGEMVDGLAGGTCQISTTLFAASFFAGLDVVSQRPHSRPSVYAPMALDATVVYPTTDLKLRNPYDFPVAIHYKVAGGEAKVEILGKLRPYDKITFDRTVVEQTPYTSEERPDDTIIAGQTSLDQPGFDGYQVVRRRTFYKGDKEVKTERWTVTYRPVTEYVRVGTSTDPNAKPAKESKAHMPKAPSGTHEHIAQ